MIKRHYHKWPCSQCGTEVSTSSYNPRYICATCRRAAGLAIAGRATNGYTSLTIAPHQVPGFGTCRKSLGGCGRREQKLSNGLCEDCRFYDMPDVDERLSKQAQRSRGGEFDWVRRRAPRATVKL